MGVGVGAVDPSLGPSVTTHSSGYVVVYGTSLAEYARFISGGDFGVGTSSAAARVHALKTTEQLRLGYDGSNYTSFTVSSGGNLTVTNSGSVTTFTKRVDLFGGHKIGASGDNLSFAGRSANFYGYLADPAGLYALSFDTTTAKVYVGVGYSGNDAAVGGVLTQFYSDVGNVGTGEDDLYSYTVASSTFSINGDKIEAEYVVVLASSATATRQLRAYFAGTAVLDSTALTLASGGTAKIRLSLVRETSSVVRVTAEFTVSGIASQPVVTYTRITGLTLSSTNILKITGEAAGAGAATDDLVAKMGVVRFLPNN